MQLSKSFHLSEFVKSQTAQRRGLDNTPPAEAISKLTDLCINVLQPLRDYFARPVVISSGYRSQEVNRAVGGSRTSQHCKGQAADLEVPGISNVEIARWIQHHLNYDQLILEFYTPGQPNSGWVHVSWRQNYRKQDLTARRVRKWGRLTTEYVPGLVA